MSGFFERDIERVVPPHPAPHDRHEKRHAYWRDFERDNGCCDNPKTHPIHLNRRRARTNAQETC